MNIPMSPCVPENLVSRDGFSRPVPRHSAHLHTQAESGAYLRDHGVQTGSPMEITLGQQYNVGEKPTVILYTYINRHAGTPGKTVKTKQRQCSTPSHMVVIIYYYIGYKYKATPMVVTLGQQYKVGEKPTVILYTYINHHAEPSIITKHKHCST